MKNPSFHVHWEMCGLKARISQELTSSCKFWNLYLISLLHSFLIYTVIKTIIEPHRPPVLPPAPPPCSLLLPPAVRQGLAGLHSWPVLCSVCSRTELCISLTVFATLTIVSITVTTVFYTKVLLVSRYIGYLTLKYTRKKERKHCVQQLVVQ